MSEQQNPSTPTPASTAATQPEAPMLSVPEPPPSSPVSQAPAPTVVQRLPDYHGEDVLKHVKMAFAETIALKVRQLRRYVPKEKARTNTELTGDFIEEVVRGFIRNWIGEQRLVSGTFYSQASEGSELRPLQIDGIVHDPRRGPAVISEGNFEVVHPAFCSGVIEIKTTTDLQALHERLNTIYTRHMFHLTADRVMGVVIASSDPEKDSIVRTARGGTLSLYDCRMAGWCPIFILFKEVDGDYEPHYPAIHSMIVAMHQLMATTNYLR